jgi:hypothetical protein
MKRLVIAVAVAASIAAGGCATDREFINASSTGTRNDVFQELATGTSIPSGYADLSVASSVKTHRVGVYPLKMDAHGTADYQLLLNVDGQVTRLSPRSGQESSEPRSLRDSEAGEGVRYAFSTRIRLKSGAHRIVIVSPADGIAVAREVVLPEGSSNILVLEPVYRGALDKQQPGASRGSFREGLRGVRMILNGEPL